MSVAIPPPETRVLMVVAAPTAERGRQIGVNGPERRSANLIRYWRKLGIGPIIAYPRRGRLWEVFARSGEALVDFEIGSKWAFHRVLKLAGIVRDQRVRVIHTQGPASLDLIAALAARMAGIKLVVTRPVMIEDMVTYSMARRLVYRLVDRVGLRLAHLVVAVSEQGRDRLAASGAVGRESLRLVRNGVDLERFRAIARSRGDRQEIVVGMTAQLTAQKAWPDFLSVIASLRAEGLPVRGLIVGSGPLRDELVALADQMGLAGFVEFAGFQEDVVPWLARMDLFLFTSRWEGLSVAVIEAMASGLPIVATDVAAIREQVVEEANGFVCQVGDLPAMVRACRRLCEEPELRLRFGVQSAARAEALYSEVDMLAGYARLYRELA